MKTNNELPSNLPGFNRGIEGFRFVRYCGFFSLILFCPPPITAQEEADEELEELEEYEVTGFREGLAKAMEEQRQSVNFKDIMAADSVGNLPDSNLAEALQRLPSVFLATDQNDGRFISIRGVDPILNNLTMDGQTTAVSDVDGRSGRAAPLDVISAAALESVEVIKVPLPDMDGQGLGGTVNVITPSAFDHEGFFAFGNAKYGSNDFCEECEIYEADVNFGLRLGGEKQFGLFVGLNTFRREYMSHRAEFRGHTVYDGSELEVLPGATGPTGTLLLAGDQRLMAADGWRRRHGMNFNLEYKPDDDTHAYVRGYAVAFEEDELRPQTVIRSREFSSAVFTSPTEGFHMRARIEAETQLENTERPVHQIVVGGKKRWNERWTIEGSANFTHAEERDPRTILLQAEAYWEEEAPGVFTKKDFEVDNRSLPHTMENAVALFDIGDFFPVTAITGAQAVHWPFPTPNGIADPGFHVFFRNRRESTIVIEDTQTYNLNLQWEGDLFGHPSKIKTGLKFLSRDKSVDDYSHRYIPSGRGPIVLDGSYNGIPYGLMMQQTGNFGRHSLGPSSGRWAGYYGDLLGPIHNPAAFEAEFQELIGPAIDEQWDEVTNLPDPATLIRVPGPWELDIGASRENGVEDDYQLTEEILAWYLMGEMNIGENLQVIGGARVERTDGNMRAFVAFDDRTPGGGGFDIVPNGPVDKSYTNVLPAVMALWQVNENMDARVSLSSSIGRPDYPDMAPIARRFRVSGSGPFSGQLQEGNPDLEPYEGLNFDANVSYYFGEGIGMIQLGFFYKDVENPIYGFGYDAVSDDIVLLNKEFERLPNGNILFRGYEMERLDIGTVNNAVSGEIAGVEFTYQQAFTFLPAPLDGFGVAANASLIDSSVTIFGRESDDLPFFQQADEIYNIQFYYQKGGFEGRLAWHYQGDALFQVGGDIYHDAYIGARDYWDAKVSYRFNRHFELFVEAKNINDAPVFHYIWNPDHIAFAPGYEVYGSTYYVGINWRFGD